MATGGGSFEEDMNDQDLPGWSNESLDDRLNNMDWESQQKKANRSSEKNKKKFGGEAETRLTNDISPESSSGMGRRKTRTHSFPHARYITQMSVPEQAELERLKQRINFSDLDQRSIGSDSQGRATAANNKRQLNENKKPFNFLSLQINTNKSKDPASGSQKKESGIPVQCKELFGAALSKDFLQNCQVSAQEDGRGEPTMDSSQIVSRLVQIRDYIAKASSMRDDLVEKNERSANVERLSHLIDHLKEQEKSYLKFLQKMLARDPQQEAKEELENLKKQHDLLKRMLQQQEQLKALQGRQAALLALQHKAEQAIAVMDDSVVTETTGSVSGVSLTSELNEELNDLIQRFHNQLHDSQTQSVPDNRRQAESLSLTREISQSRNSSVSEHLADEKTQLFNKMRMLQGKKQKMDKLLGELHTLRDQHLNNSSFFPASGSPQRSVDQRSTTSVASGPVDIVTVVNGESNSLASAPYLPDSLVSQNDSEEDESLNPTEKLQKLNEVRKRLNELRELVHYYEQTSDMMTDAVNENTKEEEETEESESDSEHEDPQPVTNIRNPQGISSWSEINSNSNVQCGTNNRDGRHLNTDCEINNRSAANIRTLKMSSTLDCHNRENDKDVELPRGEDEEVEEDRVSEDSMSSHRSSLGDAAGDAEFEQKINRLIAAKQKLRQLQNLAAMVQDDDLEPQTTITNASHIGDLFLGEMEETKQQPNNVRASTNKIQKDVGLNEKAREKFYEAKLQQQRELKQLQEERRKLIEIQEKIQVLQKACPDLQLSAGLGNCPPNRQASPATSTPAMNECNTAGKPLLEFDESVLVGNELWSEMRRHEILREELRQRRKQLEALMAEHQRRRELAETISTVAASIKSEGSETRRTPQQSRTEKTMATWGGSTQCALEEENGDEDGYLSDGDGQAEEEEEDASSLNDSLSVYPNNNVPENAYFVKENKDRWKNGRPLSADGNYRPLSKARQQQNISMQRQENLRWMSELSYVEEKEQWQEQINQLKKQHEFSVSICQTLMQDQQTLSCLLQTLLAGPYSMMPNNVASSQVHLIMHQLNQCYTQLTWQQNNIQRLKQMLNDLMRQQEEQCQEKPSRKERGHSAPPPPSPVFCPFSFTPQPVNLFNVPGFTNFSSFAPGINYNPVFPSGFGDFAYNVSQHGSELQQQQHPLDHNASGKTEYMAFPKPFESSSCNGAEKKRRSHRQPEEDIEKKSTWLNDNLKGKKDDESQLNAGFAVAGQNITPGPKNQSDTSRREFDEESLESFSSMPDPVDPTTVTKTFKSRKASAQASLASKDKTPKSKNKRKSSSQLKGRIKNTGYESASASSVCEPCKSNKSRHSEEVVHAKVFSKRNREQLEKIIKYSRSTEMSSAHARRILQQSNRNACIEAPETGSDLSMFEALRDTIYSEVATLISQNESRPHFLIELFHELQLLNTDYLRQRALYALQDIVTRHLSEKNEKEKCTKSLNSAAWIASNSELTPSESLASTDDETYVKNFSTEACRDCEQNDADNGSTISTSSNFEPFATDDLGNTVIHLDQALARMREYERMKNEAESTLDSEGCSSNFQGASAAKLEGPSTSECLPVPQSSEVSAVPCPRIDTQQLDRQIKAIMKEVIPFLKEHMDEVCSSQLLTSVRRMVLTLTQQNDESKEFVKFFHKQLGSILQDSLAKFAGRKLKDCGEDLLVEISEVLFNELAFFKLMQDLDNNSISVKQRCKRKIETTEVMQSYAKEAKKGLQLDVCSSAEDVDEDKDKDETETGKQIQNSEMYDGNGVPESIRSDGSDQEEDEESESGPVAISLSKAETQALTNYGSGEDENEDEEIEFEEGPVDVQTSLQASSETTAENEQTSNQELGKTKGSEILSSEQESVKGEQAVATVLPHYLNVVENTPPLPVSAPESFITANVKTEESSSSSPVNETETLDTTCVENKSAASSESSMAGSPDTESPVLVNEYEGGSGNVSQKSDEDDFVKVEDLPLKLAVYSEADLMKKMAMEAQANTLCDELLAGGGAQDQELVGDAQTLKEPETFGAQSA
ncbi:pericentriolar material 1 protein isoform X1 [Colius striatus]|uniref:pericentriolar material 1 protein isoform X1 n=2 Tax=Colius striatus TaxID=57412 RepID=UPI002B1D11E9|nr:pericentriolar material 1 protein isoform X1 [Colius striatus]XP_061849861.1 pericentriolar material 1 protein isoform X1 [Colius striatus]XP_061849862.1 pericentriolar material 1 protein isoform X1 [Colius striatus]